MKMPFGKYKDQDLDDIPEDYLVWVLDNCEIRPTLRRAIEVVLGLEVGSPPGPKRPTSPPTPPPPTSPPPPRSVVETVLTKWHRTLMTRHHPDRGGSKEAMHLIDEAKNLLEDLLKQNRCL